MPNLHIGGNAIYRDTVNETPAKRISRQSFGSHSVLGIYSTRGQSIDSHRVLHPHSMGELKKNEIITAKSGFR